MNEVKGCVFVDTIQFFITNKCNKKCIGCFYDKHISNHHISLEDYKTEIHKYLEKIPSIKKISLLGGEPLLHPELEQMLDFNRLLSLKTTIYTNGTKLDILNDINKKDVTIRVGILGLDAVHEKYLFEIPQVNFEFDICYMLRKNNINELTAAMKLADLYYNIRSFMVILGNI